jgi:hypothetical protein
MFGKIFGGKFKKPFAAINGRSCHALNCTYAKSAVREYMRSRVCSLQYLSMSGGELAIGEHAHEDVTVRLRKLRMR